MAHNSLILALDVSEIDYAINFVNKIKTYLGVVKIGYQFFLRYGPAGVARVMDETNLPIFLDLKLHDIPNTVFQAVQAVCDMGVSMLTIHTAGGQEMLEAAVDAKGSTEILLLGVTVLTSMQSTKEQVCERALLAMNCGVDGVICSPLEIKDIRRSCPNLKIVSPGIRLSDDTGEHKRAGTPAQAIADGADFIVVGRPILNSENPIDVAREINLRLTLH